jgi:hypothetical protein
MACTLHRFYSLRERGSVAQETGGGANRVCRKRSRPANRGHVSTKSPKKSGARSVLAKVAARREGLLGSDSSSEAAIFDVSQGFS